MFRLRDAADPSGRRVRCDMREERNPWAGKTLLLDLDKTLILCRDPDGCPTLEKVNEGARITLPALRDARATAVITTASNREYADYMAEAAGLKDRIDGIYTRGDLLYSRHGRLRFLPKSYARVMEALGEEAPHANCAVIGDDVHRDVPINPQGVVTVIAGMEIPFGKILAYLRTMLQLGDGNFAEGFDRLMDGMRKLRSVQFMRRSNWWFYGDEFGTARVMRFRPQEAGTGN